MKWGKRGCEGGFTGAKFGEVSKDNSVYGNKFIYVKCTILLKYC